MRKHISIFNFFNSSKNNILSSLCGDDLAQFLVLLNDIYIDYRYSLNNFDNTFGVELEFEEANVDFIESRLISNWILKDEQTVKSGAEVVSPVLNDNFSCWDELYKMSSLIGSHACIKQNCASHVHCGVQGLGSDINSWINFIKLYSIYENVIYRFCYGEYLSYRSSIKLYAVPVALKLYDIYLLYKKNRFDFDVLFSKLKDSRHQGVNFCNVNDVGSFSLKNTIEFRCPNGTLNPIIWQNNINLFLALLKYSCNDCFNHDVLDKRYRIVCDEMSNLIFYNEIYIEQALELCDLLFDKNIDKFYFLRQYFKSFDISSEYKKSRVFTKS